MQAEGKAFIKSGCEFKLRIVGIVKNLSTYAIENKYLILGLPGCQKFHLITD